MKYVLSFDAATYNKLDLDNMSEEERFSLASRCDTLGYDDAKVVPLDKWVELYNDGCVPKSGSLYIYLYDTCDYEVIPSQHTDKPSQPSQPTINKEEAWRFYDLIAKPQLSKYINDYDGDTSVFFIPEHKTFWYETEIDLEENWVDGENLYTQCKDMDLRDIGKFLFSKLCQYEAYYDSPKYVEGLNKMATLINN